MERVSVVVPVFYNEDTLVDLHSRLNRVAQSDARADYEFLFVDDGSGDRSLQVLTSLASRDSRVRIVKLSRNFGANNAVLAGLTRASGNCIAIIAADLQDPPELIPEMVAYWRQGSKVVLAARRDRRDPLVGKLFANAFNWLFKQLVFKDFPAQGFDFVLIDRQVANIVKDCKEKNTNLMALILWMGFQRSMIYYVRERRRAGRSRWSLAKKLKHLADSFVGFSYLPLRAASVSGFVLAFLGFGYASIIILSKLLWSINIEGWSSLMVVVLIVSGVQMIMIGILGEYIWRNLDEARRRPPFIIDEE